MAELIFPNVGNALLAGSQAAYFQGRNRKERADEQRRLDAQPNIQAALKGDTDAFGRLAAGDPTTAASVATMLGRMDANQRAKAKDAAEYTAHGANAILQADPASRPAIYRQIREDGIRRGYNLDSLPPEYNPSMDGMLRTQRSMAIPILEQMKLDEGRPTPLGDAPTAGGGPRAAIAGIESGGRYDAVGPPADAKGSRAYGKYQVMDFNIGPWTQEILGRAMTPQEFVANPEAQDKVFDGKFGQYTQKYGSPQAAARAWFAGEGGMNNPNAKDVLGTSVAGYEKKFSANLPPGSAAPGTPGPIAQPPQMAQGDSGQVGPGGMRITPESQLQPEVRSVREIVRATRPGFRVMITPKTGLPIYDSQGRLYIQGPNGEPDYLEIPKAPTAPAGYQFAPGGGSLAPIPGGPADKPQGAGPFPGNSVEANALNMLIANGTLTLQQAAEMAAGKTVTGPDGSIIFMTPSGIFGRPQGGEVQPLTPPAQAPATSPPTSLKLPPMPGAAPPAMTGARPSPTPMQPGMIPLTPPKSQGPSASEMGKLREMEAEGNSIIVALEKFKEQFKSAGVGDRLKSMTGANTPLNTSYNAAALLAKGEALFNLGVLNGPDLDIIRRTIVDPSTLKSGIVSNSDMEASVKQVEDLIKTRLAEKKKSLGVQEQAAPSGGGPKPGHVEDGYRFKGGDPAKQENWERVQ